MNPRSRSLWIFPAASGAAAPTRTVQARDSFGPIVKNDNTPSAEYVACTIVVSAPSPKPRPSRNSALSPGSNCAASASILAESTITRSPSGTTSVTRSITSPSIAPSSTFTTQTAGFRVSGARSRNETNSWSVQETVLSGNPSSRCAAARAMAAAEALRETSDIDSLAALSARREKTSASANVSSSSNVSA